MGVPNSEVGYTSAVPRREDHEVRKGHVGHWIKKKLNIHDQNPFLKYIYKTVHQYIYIYNFSSSHFFAGVYLAQQILSLLRSLSDVGLKTNLKEGKSNWYNVPLERFVKVCQNLKQYTHPVIKYAFHDDSDPALLGKLFLRFRKTYAPSSSRFGQFIL